MSLLAQHNEFYERSGRQHVDVLWMAVHIIDRMAMSPPNSATRVVFPLEQVVMRNWEEAEKIALELARLAYVVRTLSK
ncbi:MAG: hypothetical protein HQL43_10965 [Alphaproteobacteria bacterium]|nr:hypothetical protein [Alphaproteobacteria bacterium]